MLNDIQVGHYSLEKWQELFIERIKKDDYDHDPSHRFDHFKRVTNLVVKLAKYEEANLAILIPASWLHDLVPIKKSSKQRSLASKLSANAAITYLSTIDYPKQYFAAIAEAIETHSFSAGLNPLTLEGKILQDADRLDAMGAIGIARCFSCAGSMNRPLYNIDDPFAQSRVVDDSLNALDHFFQKLLLISQSMQTKAGQQEAKTRHQYLKSFIAQLKYEIV